MFSALGSLCMSWRRNGNCTLQLTPVVIIDSKLKGKPPCSLPISCPKALESLMKACCALDPNNRPTIQEVVQRLRDIVD